jgi:ribosomal protein S12 methylthiotransferase accessory factor
MLETPAFIPGWHAPVLDPIAGLVAGLIDGRRSADGIVDALSGQAQPVLVYYALEWLEQQGCIAEADSTHAEDAAPAVVEVNDYLDPRLEEQNRLALTTREPWMIAGPGSIGPLFRAGRTACWKCLAAWLEQNRPAWPTTRPSVDISPQMLEGAIWTAEPTGLRRHLLTRRPQCPACGDARAPDPLPAAPIEQTLRRLERHISPITGIVGEVETGLTFGPTHLAVAGLNGGSTIAVGKGRTEIEAKAACLAEAVERYSCRWQGDERCVRASCRELRGQAVHPAAILNHSVPIPFDEEAEIDWTPVRSLTHGCTRFVPTAFCYYGYPQDESRRFCRADSNGCAAGNTVDDAVQRGLLELIERDAAAIWWYNRVRRPAVDLGSFEDPYLAAMRQYVEGMRRTLDVLDITTDLGVPVFVAVSARDDGGAPLLGFGVHRDTRAAVASALAELSQMLAVDPAGERQEVRDWLETATLGSQPYVVPTHICGPRQGAAADPVEILATHQLEVLVLDVTRLEIGFPVARVIVPGLRHFHPRFAPGRLYDVPLRLGWLEKPLAEAELNPIPIFL